MGSYLDIVKLGLDRRRKRSVLPALIRLARRNQLNRRGRRILRKFAPHAFLFRGESLEPRILLSGDPFSATIGEGALANLESITLRVDETQTTFELVNDDGDVVSQSAIADTSEINLSVTSDADYATSFIIDKSYTAWRTAAGLDSDSSNDVAVTFVGSGQGDALEIHGDFDADWVVGENTAVYAVGEVSWFDASAIEQLNLAVEGTVDGDQDSLSSELVGGVWQAVADGVIRFGANAGADGSLLISGVDAVEGDADGTQVFDYSALGSELNLDLRAGLATAVEADGFGEISNFKHFIGSDLDDHLILSGSDLISSFDGGQPDSGDDNDRLVILDYSFDQAQISDSSVDFGDDGSISFANLELLSLLSGEGITNDMSISGAQVSNNSALKLEVTGGGGNDNIIGTVNDDILRGGGGDDVLTGRAGDDILVATLNASSIAQASILGGAGSDTVYFEMSDAINAIVLADSGASTPVIATVYNNATELGDIQATEVESVVVEGHAGDDSIDASAISGMGIVARGNDGNDSIIGGAADDVLDGGSGDDLLVGRAGADRLTGGGGSDWIYGGDSQGGNAQENDTLAEDVSGFAALGDMLSVSGEQSVVLSEIAVADANGGVDGELVVTIDGTDLAGVSVSSAALTADHAKRIQASLTAANFADYRVQAVVVDGKIQLVFFGGYTAASTNLPTVTAALSSSSQGAVTANSPQLISDSDSLTTVLGSSALRHLESLGYHDLVVDNNAAGAFKLSVGGEQLAPLMLVEDDANAARNLLADELEQAIIRLEGIEKTDFKVIWLPSEASDDNGGIFRIYYTGQNAGLAETALPVLSVDGDSVTLQSYQESSSSRDFLYDIDGVEVGGSSLTDYITAASVAEGEFAQGIIIDGQMGHDIIVGSVNSDILLGNTGDDLIDGFGGDGDTLYGHEGEDILRVALVEGAAASQVAFLSDQVTVSDGSGNNLYSATYHGFDSTSLIGTSAAESLDASGFNAFDESLELADLGGEALERGAGFDFAFVMSDERLEVSLEGANTMQDILLILQATDLDGDGEEDLADSSISGGRFIIDTGGIAVNSLESASDSNVITNIGLQGLITTANADVYQGASIQFGYAKLDGLGGDDELTGTEGNDQFIISNAGARVVEGGSGDDLMRVVTVATNVNASINSGDESLTFSDGETGSLTFAGVETITLIAESASTLNLGDLTTAVASLVAEGASITTTGEGDTIEIAQDALFAYALVLSSGQEIIITSATEHQNLLDGNWSDYISVTPNDLKLPTVYTIVANNGLSFEFVPGNEDIRPAITDVDGGFQLSQSESADLLAALASNPRDLTIASTDGEAVDLRFSAASTPLVSLAGNSAISWTSGAPASVTYAATDITLSRNILIQDSATFQFVSDSLYVGSASSADLMVIDTRDSGMTSASSLAFYGRNVEFENVVIIATPVDNAVQFVDDNSTSAVATVLGADVTSESHRDQLISMTASAASAAANAGAVTIYAKDIGSFSPFLGIYNNDISRATVALKNAHIHAGDIDIDASVDNKVILEDRDPDGSLSSDSWKNDWASTPFFGDMLANADSSALLFGMADTTTVSSIAIDEQSLMVSSTFSADALNVASATATPATMFAGAAVAILDADTTVSVSGGLFVAADATLFAKTKSTLEADSTVDSKIAIALAIGLSDSDTTANYTVGKFGYVGGDLVVQAKQIDDYTVKAVAAPKSNNSPVAIAIAVGYESSDSTASIVSASGDSELTVLGNLSVQADHSAAGSGLKANAESADGIGKKVARAKEALGLDLLQDGAKVAQGDVGELAKFIVASKLAGLITIEDAKTIQVGASVGVYEDINNTTAILGDDVALRVNVSGNVLVNAEASAKASLRVNAEVGGGKNTPMDDATASVSEKISGKGEVVKPKFAGAVAVGIIDSTNAAQANIGSGASLKVGENISVTSSSVSGDSWSTIWDENVLNLFESLSNEQSNLVSHYQSQGQVTVRPGEVVATNDGNIYRYGAGEEASLDLTSVDFSGEDWVALTGGAIHLAFSVLANSGRESAVKIEKGDLVFIDPSFLGADSAADAGTIYRFIGDTDGSMDLRATDYSDSNLWSKLELSQSRIAAMQDVAIGDDDTVRVVTGPSSGLDGKSFKYDGSIADQDLTTADFADSETWESFYASVFDVEFEWDETYQLLPGQIIKARDAIYRYTGPGEEFTYSSEDLDSSKFEAYADPSWDTISRAIDAILAVGDKGANIGAIPWIDSWVGATTDESEYGLAGAVSLNTVSQQASATISNNASIAGQNGGAAGDVTVASTARNDYLKYNNNLIPFVSSAEAGAGFSYSQVNLSSDSLAKIDDGVVLSAKKLDVTADNSGIAITVGAAGQSSGGKANFLGSVFNQYVDNTTYALVGQGSYDLNYADATAVNVAAQDNSAPVVVVGTYSASKGASVGASIGWQEVKRDTVAFFGNDERGVKGESVAEVDFNSGGTADIAGGVEVTAKNSGIHIIVAIAGSSSSASTGSTSGGSAGTPAKVGVAGSFGLIDNEDHTLAQVQGFQAFDSGAVTVSASNTTEQHIGAGGVAIAKGGTSATGIAGAVSVNITEGSTISGVRDIGIIDSGDIIVSTTRAGLMVSAAVGLGVATGASGVAITGSASWLRKDELTESVVDNIGSNPGGENSGGLSVTAVDTTSLISIGGAISYAGKAGIGAGLARAENLGSVRAVIEDLGTDQSKLRLYGDVTVSANNQLSIISVAGTLAAGGGTGVSAAGSVSLVNIALEESATVARSYIDMNADSSVPTHDLTVSAKQQVFFVSVAGAVAFGGQAGFGIGFAYTTHSGSVNATLLNSHVDDADDIKVTAQSTNSSYMIGFGLGSSKSVGIAGSAAVLRNEQLSMASVVGSQLSAADDVDVTSTITSTSLMVAGGVVRGAATVLGAAVGTQIVSADGTTGGSLAIIDSSVVTAGGDIGVSATSTFKLINVAVGVSVSSGGVGLSGSAAHSEIGGFTYAAVRNGSSITADAISITAADLSQIVTIAGSVAVGSSSGFGASVGIATITSESKALLKDSDATARSGDIDVTASFSMPDAKAALQGGGVVLAADTDSSRQILNVVVAGSGSGSGFAGGAAVGVNSIRNNVVAQIIGDGTQTVNATSGDVNVLAIDRPDILSVAVALSYGSTAGLGGAVAYNFIGGAPITDIDDLSSRNVDFTDTSSDERTTSTDSAANITASIEGVVVNARAVSVRADSMADMLSITVGGAGSGSGFAVAGSASVNFVDQNIYAQIGDDTEDSSLVTTVNTTGPLDGIDGKHSVEVVANFTPKLFNLAFGGAAGLGGVGAGAAVAINDVTNAVVANISGQNTRINLGSNDLLVSANTLQVGMSGDARFDTRSTDDNPIDLDAQIWSFSIGVGGGSYVGFAGSVNLNWIRNTTQALISDATIASNSNSSGGSAGDVTVEAYNRASLSAFAGGGSFGGTLGASIAVSLNFLGGTPDDDGVGSTSSSETSNLVKAEVDNADLVVDSLTIRSISDGTINALAISIAGGGTFAGSGAVSLNFMNRKSEARILGGSYVTSINGVHVISQDASEIHSGAGQISLGGTGAVGGAVAYNELETEVTSTIADSEVDTTVGSVEVVATSANTLGIFAAGISGGSTAGIAGSSSVNLVKSKVKAEILNSTVNSAGAVRVEARSHDLLNNYVGTLGAGGTVGAAGSVIVNDFTNSTRAFVYGGTINTGNSNVVTRGWNDSANDFQDVYRSGLVVVASSEIEIAEQVSVSVAVGGAVGIGLNLSINTIGNDRNNIGTEAYVKGATVNQGAGNGALYVQALHRTYSKSYGGALGVGLTTAGAGASVDTNIFSRNVKAWLDNASISSSSASDDNNHNYTDAIIGAHSYEEVDSVAVAGGAGLYAGLAGAGGGG